MENQEILELLTLIATIFIGVVGFGFTFYQIHRSNQVKQAEFISTLLDHIRFNERVMNAVYIIDYNSNWYNEKFHGSGEMEKNIDAFFSVIDYVCYLFNRKLLSKKDFLIFKYEVLRICNNYQCQCYLWNLYHWAKRNHTKCSFNNLIEFLKSQFTAEEIDKFESDVELKKSYKKYLNF